MGRERGQANYQNFVAVQHVKTGGNDFLPVPFLFIGGGNAKENVSRLFSYDTVLAFFGFPM